MQGITLPLDEFASFLRQDTDTATTRTLVPILYIHSLKHPFCGHHLCACRQTHKNAAHLLGFISEGSLVVQEAVAFLDDEREEKKR